MPASNFEPLMPMIRPDSSTHNQISKHQTQSLKTVTVFVLQRHSLLLSLTDITADSLTFLLRVTGESLPNITASSHSARLNMTEPAKHHRPAPGQASTCRRWSHTTDHTQVKQSKSNQAEILSI